MDPAPRIRQLAFGRPWGGCLLGLLALACNGSPTTTSGGLPDHMLWAWRRPEALTFVDPTRTGVAAWMATVHLEGDELRTEQRQWRLTVKEGTYLAFVVRLESALDSPPDLSTDQRLELVTLLLELWRDTGWPELQLDFDARTSERDFYRKLLADLRRAEPKGRVSITALLSWCWEPGWLDELAVDEVVPMIYRLGPESDLFRRRLERGDRFTARVCNRALGVSSDEPVPGFGHDGRLFLFHHRPWTAESYRQELHRVRQALRKESSNTG